MDPFAATPRLQIGQSVIALRNTYVCRTGQIGTVLEEHMVGDRPDWLIRFARGGLDGWNPCEVGLWLQPSPVGTEPPGL